MDRHAGEPRTAEQSRQLRSAVVRDAEEFFAIYRSSDALDPRLGPSLLADAVANKDVGSRMAIMIRLMDDGVDVGADVRGGRVLNQFLAHRVHDFEAEVPLLQRLLDEGADVMWASGTHGTPLECLAAQFRYDEDTIAPFVDVLLAHPDFDPLGPGRSGRTVLATVRTWRRPRLVERLEVLLAERGVELSPGAIESQLGEIGAVDEDLNEDSDENEDADEDEIVSDDPAVIMAVLRRLLGMDFAEDDSVEAVVDGFEVISLPCAHLLPLGVTTDADALTAVCDGVASMADAAWGRARRFEVQESYLQAYVADDALPDLRHVPALMVRSLGADQALWWPATAELAAVLVNNTHADPETYKAAVIVLPREWLMGVPPDLLLWESLHDDGEANPWSDRGMSFLRGDREPEALDLSYLTNADRANAGVMANVEATALTASMVTWVAEDDDSRAIGYWRGPDDVPLEQAPIVTLDSEQQFWLLRGRTFSEAMCDDVAADSDDPDAAFANLADQCRELGVAIEAERPGDIPEPTTGTDPNQLRGEYERILAARTDPRDPRAKRTHIAESNGAVRGPLIDTIRPYPEQIRYSLNRLDGSSSWSYGLWRAPKDADLLHDIPLSDEYLQCAGTARAMTVEVRVIDPAGTAHQYTVGKPGGGQAGEPTEVIRWDEGRHSTKVYPHEVFTADEAAHIFYAYFLTDQVGEPYVLRELDL